jgi:hypothetical protein
MKMYGRVKVQLHSLTLGIRGELSVSQATSRKETSGIHGVRGWVGPRTGLLAVASREIVDLARYQNLILLSSQRLITIPTEPPRLQTEINSDQLLMPGE